MISRYPLQAAAFGLFMGIASLPIAQATGPAPLPVKPAISDEAGSAVSRMGKALLAKELSFTAKTIRVYLDGSGQPVLSKNWNEAVTLLRGSRSSAFRQGEHDSR